MNITEQQPLHLSPLARELASGEMRERIERMGSGELARADKVFEETLRVWETKVMFVRGQPANTASIPLSRERAEAGRELVRELLPAAERREAEARAEQERQEQQERERRRAVALTEAKKAAAVARMARGSEDMAYREANVLIARSPFGQILTQKAVTRRMAFDFNRAWRMLDGDAEGQQALLDDLGEDGTAVRCALHLVDPEHSARLRPEALAEQLEHRELIDNIIFNLGAFLAAAGRR